MFEDQKGGEHGKLSESETVGSKERDSGRNQQGPDHPGPQRLWVRSTSLEAFKWEVT